MFLSFAMHPLHAYSTSVDFAINIYIIIKTKTDIQKKFIPNSIFGRNMPMYHDYRNKLLQE